MTGMDLRCQGRKHGELLTPSEDMGLVEFKCPSRWCGAGPGVVVLHIFRTDTGVLFRTDKYRQPRIGGKDAAQHNSASIRSA